MRNHLWGMAGECAGRGGGLEGVWKSTSTNTRSEKKLLSLKERTLIILRFHPTLDDCLDFLKGFIFFVFFPQPLFSIYCRLCHKGWAGNYFSSSNIYLTFTTNLLASSVSAGSSRTHELVLSVGLVVPGLWDPTCGRQRGATFLWLECNTRDQETQF